MKAFLRTLLVLLLLTGVAHSRQIGESESSMSLPRMVSLRSDNVHARSGPGKKYPIEWIYKQKGAPLEIINEFELWRQVRDWEGSVSWIHKTLLTGKRFAKVITPGINNIYQRPDSEAKIVAKVEDGAIGEIKKCPKKSEFCLIKFESIEGWVNKKNVFGVYENEVL